MEHIDADNVYMYQTPFRLYNTCLKFSNDAEVQQMNIKHLEQKYSDTKNTNSSFSM